MTRAELARLGRTAVHLRPGQAAHRARLRAQQAGLRRFPGAAGRLLSGPDPSAAVGWPDAFRPADALTPGRWPSLPELRAGKIALLGLVRELGDEGGWAHAGAPRLWRFWCGLHRDLVAGSDIEPAFVAGLAAHAGFLRRHLEYDVGGNHLIKGLKAVAGLAVFFADERLLRRAVGRLASQLARQVLADGGHYERAPAYHCQVLADLIDVADLLCAAGRPPADEITTAIDRMRRWLGAVLAPDGQVPLLNDGYPVDRELIWLLRPGPAPDDPLHVLPATGLVRAVAGGWHLLAGAGPPCPPSLPAHAHADTFGCVLHVDKVPLLIDTGTSSYESGPVRRYERSTAAHNTVEVDGADSTEVWGAFRAGRRARVSGLAASADSSGLTCEAVHDGFRHLPGRPLHRRRWSLTGDGLRVEDAVTGRGRHEIVIRWHVSPGSALRVDGRTALVTSPAGTFSVTIAATTPVLLAAETRPAATGFGSTADAPVLTCRMDATLPVRAVTAWNRARDHAAGEGSS